MAEVGEGSSIEKVNPIPGVVRPEDRLPNPQERKKNLPEDKPKQVETELGDTPPRLDQGKRIDKLG